MPTATSHPHHDRPAKRRRLTRRPCWRLNVRQLLVELLVVAVSLGWLPIVDAAAVPVPTTPNFRFDGRHSDYTQQLYVRFLAGDELPRLDWVTSDLLPTNISSRLTQLSLYWRDLPGLLQRALLWDYGYAIALNNQIVKLYTRCGRSMAQIHVPYKAYRRIGCSPKYCSVPTGEITHRHKYCDASQAMRISLCAAEDADVSPAHADMWGEGADDDLVPDVTLMRHSWVDHADPQLMYSLHSVQPDVAYNFCPARPAPIIPCAPYRLVKDRNAFCRPPNGPIIDPWLQNFADAERPHNSWIILEVIFVMMLVGSTIYGTSNHFRNKKNAHLLAREFEELREALEIWRQGPRGDKNSDALTAELDMEDMENALDAAAVEYFDSSIGLMASAHFQPNDLLSSRSSLSLQTLVREGSSEESSSLLESGRGFNSLLESARGFNSSGGPDFLLGTMGRSRHFERSVSTSSAISLLSGRRSQVALRSFHLFESHSLIRRRRVPFRDIQFNELLSQGTSGEVWRCTLRGQEVAVKQLLPTRRRLLKEMELFMAEVYLLSQLTHPNIVTLVGVAWNTLEHVVMVQEWLQRGDLQTFLKLQKKQHRCRLPQPEDDASESDEESEYHDADSHDPLLDGSYHERGAFTWQNHKLVIAQSVARALAYLHGLTPQLLHRDVKSKNVLLSAAMEVKLCDFGISRRKHHMDEDETNLTVTEAAGTMSWTAPEVLLGDDYGEKVDIYSYGIMLCEVDTCVLPYHDAESLASRLIFHPLRLMKMVISQGLRPAISPACPPKIASLIHACLDADPEKRPDAFEIVAYLSSDDIV